MIQDLCNWNDTFVGEKAKWIDECTSSNAAQEITLKDWVFLSSLADFIILGGEQLDGDGCIRFASWSSWAPYVAQTAMEHAGGWVSALLGEPEYEETEDKMETILDDWKARDRATREKWNW